MMFREILKKNFYIYIKAAGIFLCYYLSFKFAINDDIFSKGYFHYGGEQFNLIWYLTILLSLILYTLSNFIKVSSCPTIYSLILLIVILVSLFIFYHGILIISGLIAVLSINDLVLFKKEQDQKSSA